MVTIILLIILFLAALLFVPFARQLAKDKMELAANPINEKFGILWVSSMMRFLPVEVRSLFSMIIQNS